MAHDWTCGHCGRDVSANPSSSFNSYYAVVCPSCRAMSVLGRFGATYPPARAYPPVQHLPTDVNVAWEEAVAAFGANAFTASEVMCRKILMHVAVDAAESAAGKNFAEYINDLDDAGYIPTGLKPKIEEVRSRGNIANHELPASTREEADRTLMVTRHLLVSIYELPNT